MKIKQVLSVVFTVLVIFALWQNEVLGAPICDMCSEPVGEEECYCLSTEQVVTEPAYWVYYFSALLRHANQPQSAASDPEIQSFFEGVVRQQCASASGWLICESCITSFAAVDKTEAYTYWQQWIAEGSPGGFCPTSDFDAVSVSVADDAVAAAYADLADK